MRAFALGVAVAGALLTILAVPASGHVTVQPAEAPAGSFSRFLVRVPTERDDASTVKVEVQFPENVTNAAFQPKQGWTRTVTMRTLDEPIEVFGEPVTEVIDTVVWEGGAIAPGEFDEFGFSVRTPDQPGELRFPAVQTYDSGEEVRWVGKPDSDAPAGHVTVTAAEDEVAGGHGAASGGEPSPTPTVGVDGDETAGLETVRPSVALPTVLGALGTLLGAAALFLVARRDR